MKKKASRETASPAARKQAVKKVTAASGKEKAKKAGSPAGAKKQAAKSTPAAKAVKQPEKKGPSALDKKRPAKKEPGAPKKELPKKAAPAPAEKEHHAKEEPAAIEKKPAKQVASPVPARELPAKKEIAPGVLGTRFKCYKCGTKFYDLGKEQPICPSCGVNQGDDESKGIHKRKKRRRPAPFVRPDHAITAPVEGDELIEVVNELDEEYVLDVDDIVLEESEE